MSVLRPGSVPSNALLADYVDHCYIQQCVVHQLVFAEKYTLLSIVHDVYGLEVPGLKDRAVVMHRLARKQANKISMSSMQAELVCKGSIRERIRVDCHRLGMS